MAAGRGVSGLARRWPAWPSRWCATARSSRVASASVTSAPARRSPPRRCSTWPRCPSRSSRPRSCRSRPLGTPASRCSTSMPRSRDWVPGVHPGRRSGREVTARRSAEPHERSPRRRGLRLARPAARRRRAQRVRSQPVGLAAAVGARLGVLLLQRRVRAARAAAVQGHRHDVRGRRPAAGPASARHAEQHLPARRGARRTWLPHRTWGCR